MGVKLQRVKVHEAQTTDGRTITSYAVWTDTEHPPLTPLVGITRSTDEGRASKVSVPYIETTAANVVEYKTVWVPLGQEGWTVKLQTTLTYKWLTQTSEYDPMSDAIYIWQSVDTGQILLVESNQCDDQGRHDTTLPKFDRLTPGSLWYVDKIMIESIDAVQRMARMELTLVRCWIA